MKSLEENLFYIYINYTRSEIIYLYIKNNGRKILKFWNNKNGEIYWWIVFKTLLNYEK